MDLSVVDPHITRALVCILMALILTVMHLCRGPSEPINPEVQGFYAKLLQALKGRICREGTWGPLQPQATWPENWTHDDFVAYTWADDQGSRYVVVVNYAGNQGQCR